MYSRPSIFSEKNDRYILLAALLLLRCCYRSSGDCCECTCVSTHFFCGFHYEFSCIDPTSGCVDPMTAEYPNCTAYFAWMGDGYCDVEHNNELCDYDLGEK